MRNFVTSLVVGKSGGGANVGTSLDSIRKGDILVVDANSGSVITGSNATVSTNPVICIAHAIEDGKPIISGAIYGKHLVGGGKSAYVAPVQQKITVGANALDSQALPTKSEAEEFNFSVVLKTDLRLVPNRQDRVDYSVISTGGYDLAVKMLRAVNAPVDINPHLSAPKYVKAVVTSDGTATNIGTNATADVTYNGTNVEFGAVHGIASAGGYIKFPTYGVFKVAAVVDTTNITLDRPYPGATTQFAADTVKLMTSAANFGVEFEAVEIKRTNPVDKYDQVSFTIGLSENFGINPTVTQAKVTGKGTGWQLRDKEIACLGYNGYTDRRDVMRQEYPFQTDLSKSYLTVELSSEAQILGDFQQVIGAPQSVFIAFDNAASTQSTAVLGILAPWAASGGVSLS